MLQFHECLVSLYRKQIISIFYCCKNSLRFDILYLNIQSLKVEINVMKGLRLSQLYGFKKKLLCLKPRVLLINWVEWSEWKTVWTYRQWTWVLRWCFTIMRTTSEHNLLNADQSPMEIKCNLIWYLSLVISLEILSAKRLPKRTTFAFFTTLL